MSRSVIRSLPLLALLVTQVAMSSPASAAPGDLDPSFGIGGKVTTDFAVNGGSDDYGQAVGLQPNGKIVVAGTSFFAATGGGPGSEFILARYNSDGSLDASFGSGGKVATDFPGTDGSRAEAMALQPDGKIVAAGVAFDGTDPDVNGYFALARYDPNGALDPTFGTGGTVTTDFSPYFETAFAVVIQPDGKIIAAGYSLVSGFGLEWTLVRYDADGSLDTTFGTAGVVRSPLIESVYALALQPDGKIVAAGDAFQKAAFARYNTDGSLDPTFGTGGDVMMSLGGDDDVATGLAIQPDGKIVASGTSLDELTSTFGFVAMRFTPGGSLDASFGSGGMAITSFGGSAADASAIALQPDGKILAGGWTRTSSEGPIFALARYNADGSPDGSFGVGGRVTMGFSGDEGNVSALALQPDGKIVAAGSRLTSVGEDFAVARFQGASSPPTPTISSFAPLSGPVGASVTIAGVNLAGTTAVWFNNTSQRAFTVDATGTMIATSVPAGATSGPIRVTTPAGTATSLDSFIVTAGAHERNVTLSLKGHLRATGNVVVTDAYAACEQDALVRIQRHVADRWRTIAFERSDADGFFTDRLPDLTGWYRARIGQATLANGDVCNRAISGTRHHFA